MDSADSDASGDSGDGGDNDDSGDSSHCVYFRSPLSLVVTLSPLLPLSLVLSPSHVILSSLSPLPKSLYRSSYTSSKQSWDRNLSSLPNVRRTDGFETWKLVLKLVQKFKRR